MVLANAWSRQWWVKFWLVLAPNREAECPESGHVPKWSLWKHINTGINNKQNKQNALKDSLTRSRTKLQTLSQPVVRPNCSCLINWRRKPLRTGVESHLECYLSDLNAILKSVERVSAQSYPVNNDKTACCKSWWEAAAYLQTNCFAQSCFPAEIRIWLSSNLNKEAS